MFSVWQQHVSQKLIYFLCFTQVQLLPWPATSPDLSLVENVWSVIVRELSEDLRAPARRLSAEELWEAVRAKWEELRARRDYFCRLATSLFVC